MPSTHLIIAQRQLYLISAQFQLATEVYIHTITSHLYDMYMASFAADFHPFIFWVLRRLQLCLRTTQLLLITL